jgi:hypothetical protein
MRRSILTVPRRGPLRFPISEVAFHRPLRLAVAGLIGTGVLLAVTAAVLAFTRVGPRDGAIYTVVAAMLAAMAAGIARGVRWLAWLSLVVCAGQLAAVIGTVLELAYGVAPVKAGQLRALGFNPRVGVAINLGFSAIGFGLFCWFAVRWWQRRVRR